MKTKQQFLNEFSSYPELAKRTLKAGGLSWSEICEMREDAYAADIGAVPEMIYYSDTVRFAKKESGFNPGCAGPI